MEKVLALEGGCSEEELEYIGSSIPFSRYHFTEKDVKRLKSFFVPRYTAHCRERRRPTKAYRRCFLPFGAMAF